ncbi:hypothetical protein BGX28_006795 [Mortierella sp. GBA30]|nr:hypothetical protein BGX28_006795 [Mortierella sp. GBA30]
MAHQSSQDSTRDASSAPTGADAMPTSSQRTKASHPPPVHSNNNQAYNIHQRIRQQQHAGGGRMNPSIRQSWLFPTNRASPSTALPETTSVMTLSHRPNNSRTEGSSASTNTAVGMASTGSTIINSVPPSAGMNSRARRNFSGSARSRLTKIDRLSKMLSANSSAPNLTDSNPSSFPSPASPRRPRLSLQSQSNTLTTAETSTTTSSISPNGFDHKADSDVNVHVSEPLASASAVATDSTLFQQKLGAPHATNNANYPRHIVMHATPCHGTIEDHLKKNPSSDALSSSLPATSAFPPGIELNGHARESSSSSANTEKANRHASMPLPKPGWRLHDLPDTDESEEAQGQDRGEGSGSGFKVDDDVQSGFKYSASNASSTTHLENHQHPYLNHRPTPAHGRQESGSTFYTMTPNASNLDLSLASSSHTNLSSIMEPSTASLESNPVASRIANNGSAALSGNGLYHPVTKAIKNSKSPLALRRSSTTSSTSSSSPSSTYLGKGSFPKSSLSSIQHHESKTLTQERQKIVLEILRTERSYVDGLIVLQTLFYEPLNAPYATGNNSGMNTTTSLYSNHNHQHHTHQQHHQHINNKHTNTIMGGVGSAASYPASTTLSASNSYYASSTMGSNSTLSASVAPLLSKKSVSEIFSNFSEILQVNTLLLTQLETRICGATFSTGWESDEEDEEADTGGVIKEEDSNAQDGDEDDDYPCQDQTLPSPEHQQQQDADQKPKQVLVTVKSQGGEKEELLVLDADWCIGDIFIEIAPFLKMYSNYVKTYTSALTHINECMSRNDRFTEFLKTTTKRPECKSLDFQSYLMLPVQRIPRYRMLLESLLRHTPQDHPDHRKLQTAFQSMEQTANFVNETIRQHEMFREMVELQSKISGLSEPLVKPGRILLKRGNVWKISRRKVQPRMIILLSDCILWTSPSINPLEDTLTFHRIVKLESCTVVGVEDPDPTKHAFQIISPEKSSEVYVDSPKEKEAWMVAIRKATQEYLSAKRTLKISITPMQTIGPAVSSFATGLLRLETGFWSPTALNFGFESRSNTSASNVCVDPDNYNAPNILIKGTHSEKFGRACDVCIDTMFPEEANMVSPVSIDAISTEQSPANGHHPAQDGNEPDRRASLHSMDGVLIRPEDYQETSNALNAGATGMVRGIVEAGLNRMKSRSTQVLRTETNKSQTTVNQDGDSQAREHVRASNRKSDSSGFSNSLSDHQNVAQVKECGLCKAEFSMFKWRNICSQCRRVVCSDCLTKKQIDQLFLLGLEAEREAKALGDTTAVADPSQDTVNELALNSPEQSQLLSPQINQSDSAAVKADDVSAANSFSTPAIAQHMQPRNHNFNSDSNSGNNTGNGYGSFGSGWRGIKGNTDSGHGHAEKLCDPCYLGLSADQVQVLESGGGWQYYQATLSKNQTQGIAAALAMGDLDLEDDVAEEEGTSARAI